MEALESRQLLSASPIVLNAATQQLTITGTSKNDHISVSVKGTKLVAKMDGHTKKFSTTSVQSLAVNGGAGNDVITVAPAVTAPATLDGGPGNNVLQGGGGTDTFVPAGGTDAVFGFHAGDAGEDGSNGQAGKAGMGGAFFGSVASVDATANTVTLSTFAQNSAVQSKTFKVTTTTTITVDGQPATLAALGSLTSGAHVVLQVSATDKTTATSIAAVGPHVEGPVVSVDTAAGTITLQGQNGAANTTYTVGTTAAITVGGAASTLSTVTAGANVQLWLSASNGTTVVAVDVGAPVQTGGPLGNGGPGKPGGPGQSPGQGGPAIGAIVSVDTTAGTVTLSVLSPSGATQQTFTVASTTTVTVDGATATLADLAKLGSSARVIVQAPSGSTAATSISAVGPHVDGLVVSVDSTADTITIQGPNGSASQTYTLASTAVVNVDGSASTLSALTAGTEVHLRLAAADGATVIAIDAGNPGGPAPRRQWRLGAPAGNGGTGDTGGNPGSSDGGSGNSGGPGQGGPGQGGPGQGGPVQGGAAAGTVASVDTTANTVTLSVLSEAGTTQQETFTVASDTKITVDGKSASLSNLTGLSSTARVFVQTASGSTTAAASISAVGPHAGGPVTAVDTTAGTITVQGPGSQAATTYTVGSAATVTVNGSAGSLSGIAAGDGVQIQLSALDGTTVVSLNAFTQSAGPGGQGGAPGTGTAGQGGAPGTGTGGQGGAPRRHWHRRHGGPR